MHYTLLMEPIAHIQTDFAQKFGIPRQSGLVASLEGRIVFEPAYAVPDAVRGLDAFSHVWLIWEFENDEREFEDGNNDHQQSGSANTGAADREKPERPSWSPLVRPPRLGGDKKMGVFATRSPNRPNRIALSCVRLIRVELAYARDVYDYPSASSTASCGPGISSPLCGAAAAPPSRTAIPSAFELSPDALVPVLYVGGADLRNNTPIYDIKPYLPEVDAHPEATGGFVDDIPWHKLPVNIAPELLARIPVEKQEALLGVLSEDPRPARMHNHTDTKEYKLTFAQKEIRFTVTGSADSSIIHVVSID